MEAVEPFKLHPTSMRYTILHIYKVFEHIDIIDMLSIGIQQQPSYTVTIPILVGSDFWVLGHLWSQNDVNTSWSGVFAPPANALDLSIEEPPLLHMHRQVASSSALLPMQSCQCAWPLN